MKAYSCEEALESSFRWKVASCIIWNSLILYALCYVAPGLVGREMDIPYLAEVVKVDLLLGLVLMVKVWTFTSTRYVDFPDCCTSSGEVKKLFTATSFFHAVLVVYLALFPSAFRTIGVILGVFRPGDADQWLTSLALALGFISGLSYLLNHEYVHIWSPTPVPRTIHLLRSIPSAITTAAVRSAGVTAIIVAAWSARKNTEVRTLFENYTSGWRLFYEMFAVGFVMLVVDLLFVAMMHNFLTKPPKLDVENPLGEQLAVVGLKQMSPPNVQFICFQDLLRVSNQSSNRFLSIFNPRTLQWSILLERGLDCMRTVAVKIRSRTSAKVEHEGPRNNRGKSWVDRWSFALYSVFNEEFEVRFRRELYQMAALANVASATLTNFMLRSVAMECEHYVHRDNGIGRVLESQWQAYLEVRRYQGEDPGVDLLWFILEMRDNMKRLYSKFREAHPGVGRETEEKLMELVQTEGK